MRGDLHGEPRLFDRPIRCKYGQYWIFSNLCWLLFSLLFSRSPPISPLELTNPHSLRYDLLLSGICTVQYIGTALTGQVQYVVLPCILRTERFQYHPALRHT